MVKASWAAERIRASKKARANLEANGPPGEGPTSISLAAMRATRSHGSGDLAQAGLLAHPLKRQLVRRLRPQLLLAALRAPATGR
eukprot:7188264-Pyramimonas_sp.AAC.1